MTKSPLDISFDELEAAARSAGERADQAARKAGIAVAGLVERPAAEVLPLPVRRRRRSAPVARRA